ncbi:18314_t:CDS:2, partial [Gigaspora rosea]
YLYLAVENLPGKRNVESTCYQLLPHLSLMISAKPSILQGRSISN